MNVLVDILATVAALSTAVIFGTDMVTALVLGPAFAEIDDHAMVQIVGRTHRFGGRRLPVPGVLSVVAAAVTAGVAFVAGGVVGGAFAAAGLAMLLIWLVLFNRVSLPINKVLIAASDAGRTPSDARALQARWESILPLRVTLQGLALTAFCVTIAVGTR